MFIFDVNTPEKLERVLHDQPVIREFDGNRMEMVVQEESKGVVSWKVRFYEAGFPEIQEEDIKEIAFPQDEIKNALQKIYSRVKLKEEVNPSTGLVERIYFMCMK